MANNRISVVIDVIADKATRGVDSFRKSIADADGATGKFKAGASSAFSGIKANAGELAMAGGAALIAFGAKSVAAFQDLAIESGRMSEALGVPVEEMSRLVEVAGDLGVESSSLEAVLGKMNQTAGKSPAAFEAIGAEIVKTSSGATDVNATFLATVDALNRIEDPAKRAAAAQQIFGKSWRDSAELIGLSSQQITRAMGEVSDAKVINEDEVKKARDYRAAMDALSDSIEDLMLNVGAALVPVITQAAETTDDARGAFADLDKALGPVDESLAKLAVTNWKYLNPAGQAITALEKWGDRSKDTAGTIGDLTAATDAGADATEDATEATEEATTQTDAWAKALEDATQRWDGLTGQLDANDAVRNTAQQFDDLAEAALLAWEAGSTNAADAEEKQRAYQQSVDDTKREVLALVDQLGKVPTQVTTQVLALIDEGKFEEAERRLAMLTTARNVYVNAIARGGGFQGTVAGTKSHEGSIVGGPSFGGLKDDEVPMILQRGEAVLTKGQQESVVDAMAGRGSGTATTTINLTVNSLDARTAGKQIKQALDEYYRSGGQR